MRKIKQTLARIVVVVVVVLKKTCEFIASCSHTISNIVGTKYIQVIRSERRE